MTAERRALMFALLALCEAVELTWHPDQDYLVAHLPGGTVHRVSFEVYDQLVSRRWLSATEDEVTPTYRGRQEARRFADEYRVRIQAPDTRE